MKAVFTYGPLGIWALTMVVFVLPCRLGVRAQAIWAMLLLVCFSKFVCYAVLGGSAFNPALPTGLLWAWNWAYSGAMILFALAVVGFWLPGIMRLWGFPILAWGLAAWGLWNGIKAPVVHELTLDYPDLPVALDGYRIAQITDLHVSSAAKRDRTEATVRAVNAAEPDLICLTGDLVDGRPADFRADLEPIKDLKAPDGVWAVTGNHEAYYPIDLWQDDYAKWGIRFLRNSCVFPHEGLALGGVDDQRVAEKCACGLKPDVGRAFAAATNGEFRVLLRHQPLRVFDSLVRKGVRLQLSGHTHGGIAPGLSALVAWKNGGFVRGLYEHGIGKLYVSPGSGQWAGFPMRFLNDPEVTLITLRRK